jgi:hypothetical protein
MCSAAVCVLRPTGGKEGSIAATIAATPASGAIIFTNQADIAANAVNVKATNSPVTINRVDLNFNLRPWLYFARISIYDGTTLAGSKDITASTATEITVGTSYTVRVEGLNILVADGETKVITAKLTGAAALPAGVTTQAVITDFLANAIRGTDGAGISQYAPAALLATRTVTATTGDAAVIEVSTAAVNPSVARPGQVGETATTYDIPLLAISLKAKYNGAVLRGLRFDTSASTSLANIIAGYKLYDGDTNIASTSTEAAAISTRFDGLNLAIAKDQTKTIWLKADVLSTTAHYAEGEWASTSLDAASATNEIEAEDATTYAGTAITGSRAQGTAVYFYTMAPTLALGSVSIAADPPIAPSSSYSANATIQIKVTPIGGDIYIPVASSTAASSGILASSQNETGSTTLTQSFSTTDASLSPSGYNWVVRLGETKTFTVTGVLRNLDVYFNVFERMLLTNIKWSTTDISLNDATNTWDWGLTNFKTPEVFLNANT